MKTTLVRTLILIASVGAAQAAMTYSGNGRSSFGGPVGGGSLQFSDDGTDLTITFTRGSADFNDFLVFYFDTVAGGATSLPTSGEIGSPFDGRRAIVNEFGSGVTFGGGFGSDYAFALKANASVSNHLFTTAAGNNANDLGFVSTYTVSNFGSNNAATYSWTVPVADLGLNAGDSFDFVTTYLNPNGGGGSDASYRSNEAFGSTDPGGTEPGFSAYTFTVSDSYTLVPEPSIALLGGLGLLGLLRRRRD